MVRNRSRFHLLDDFHDERTVAFNGDCSPHKESGKDTHGRPGTIWVPHSATLRFGIEFIALHFSHLDFAVADKRFLHSFRMAADFFLLVADCPFIEIKRSYDDRQWTAIGQSC